MIQKYKWVLLSTAIIFVSYLLYNAGNYLVVDNIPSKADAIVVFSGDRGSRMIRAAELYHQGYAPVVLISGGRVYDTVIISSLMKDHALRLGVPESAILLEEAADSTHQNAEYTLPLLKKFHLDRVLVVTSDYHTRRTLWTLDNIYSPAGVDFTVIAADDPGFNQNAWWSDNKSIMATIQEYIKLIGYQVGEAK